MESFLFYPFAFTAVAGAVGVVTFRRPTRALLSLLLTLFSLAVLFVLLKAYFVAMVHLIVYAGAVIVLFLFVIMLLGIGAQEPGTIRNLPNPFLALCLFVPVCFLGILLYLAASLGPQMLKPQEGAPESIGKILFTHYLLPFELVSFLLLIGVFAAVMLVSDQKAGAGLKPAPTENPS